MKIYNTPCELLDGIRLDPYYYDPVFIEHEKMMRRSFARRDSVGDVFHVLDGTHDSVDTRDCADDEFAITFLRSQDIGACLLRPNAGVYLRNSDHNGKCKRSKIVHGDVLLNIMASTGQSCMYLPSYPSEANANRAVGILRSRVANHAEEEKLFLSVLLSSQAGGLELARNLKGSIQQRLNLLDISNVRFPRVASLVYRYFAVKVRQAERLRSVSRSIKERLSSAMLSCFAGSPKPTRSYYSRVDAVNAKVNRLEAEYYDNIALWAETEILTSSFATKRLGELATRIKDGPGGWGVSTNDYVGSGVPVIRGVNIVDGDCDLRDCVFISPEKHCELQGHRATKGSVVLSVRGTIGRSAVFDLPGIDEASLNAAVVTIDCGNEIEPHYLAEFFNSDIGHIQTRRIANGAVQQNMNLTETQSNLIVVPPMEFQLNIARRRKFGINLGRISRQLVDSAKLLVESLIERQVTEDELIHAQTRLEQGDQSADRAILSRLYEGGWDADHTRPLFPDLDAYYETLRMVERESAEAPEK